MEHSVYSHNYDNYVQYAQLYLVKNFLEYFVPRTILVVIDHTHEHIFPNLSCFLCLTHSNFLTFPSFLGEWPPCWWTIYLLP